MKHFFFLINKRETKNKDQKKSQKKKKIKKKIKKFDVQVWEEYYGK
jgi:preprotein translocase subunit SecE